MVSVKIENIVARARLANRFDLEEVSSKLIGSVYNPEQFEAVLYKLLSPRAAFLILKNGKVMCTGLTKIEDIKEAYGQLASMLSREGIEVKEVFDIELRGVVSSFDLNQEIDLEALVHLLENDAEYDSDVVPAVVYHLPEPPSSALIFSNGKVVITGPKDLEETKVAVKKVIDTLVESGLAVV